MAGNTVQFVDSIASSPTVRLDLNDETTWATTNFDAPPPKVRRNLAQNTLSNGGYVAASSYEMRTLTLTLEVITTSQDLNATELQKLARELDRETNYIKYQPLTMTKPVFFKTYRSDTTQILDMLAAKAYRTITIEVLADPFALGLEEQLVSAVAITNDPASGTNKAFYSLGTVLGDVPAPLRITTTSIAGFASATGKTPLIGLCALPSGTTLTGPWYVQAESLTQGTNTTSGADAAYSGGNKSTCTFGTNDLSVTRLSGNVTAPYNGDYRVFVRVGKVTSTDTFQMRVRFFGNTLSNVVGKTVNYLGDAAAAAAGPHWIDLGVFRLPMGSGKVPATSSFSPASVELRFNMQRTSGAGNAYIDSFMFVPVKIDRGIACHLSMNNCVEIQTGETMVFDTDNSAAYSYTAGSPNTVAGKTAGYTYVGGLPYVYPGANNYLHWLAGVGQIATYYGGGSSVGIYVKDEAITATTTINAYYYPRYLYVRPSAS